MRWMFICLVMLNVLYFSWQQYVVHNLASAPNTTSELPSHDAGVKTLTLLSEQPLEGSE